jgi:hypothetical protein
VLVRSAITFQGFERSLKQLFRYDGIEPAYNNAEPHAPRIELPFNDSRHDRSENAASLFRSGGKLREEMT